MLHVLAGPNAMLRVVAAQIPGLIWSFCKITTKDRFLAKWPPCPVQDLMKEAVKTQLSIMQLTETLNDAASQIVRL